MKRKRKKTSLYRDLEREIQNLPRWIGRGLSQQQYSVCFGCLSLFSDQNSLFVQYLTFLFLDFLFFFLLLNMNFFFF